MLFIGHALGRTAHNISKKLLKATLAHLALALGDKTSTERQQDVRTLCASQGSKELPQRTNFSTDLPNGWRTGVASCCCIRVGI